MMLFYEGNEHIDYYNQLYANLITFEAVGLIFGWMLVGVFLCKLWRISAVHVNFRIMFSVIALQYGLANTIRLLSKLFFVYVHEPKWLINALAMSTNVVHVWALNLGIMTVLFIACERLWATVRSEGYEHRSAKIACFLLAIELAIGLVFSIVAEVYKQHDPTVHCKLCPIYEAIPISYLHGWIQSTICCFIGCIIISILHWYNRKQRKDYAHALSSRFQYQENILATQTLMPVVYGYVLVECFGLPTASLIPGLLKKFPAEDVRVQILLQICYLIIDWYNYLSILVVMVVFRPIRLSLAQDVHMIFCSSEEPSTISRSASSQLDCQSREQQSHYEMELHFRNLKLDWETRRLNRIAASKH